MSGDSCVQPRPDRVREVYYYVVNRGRVFHINTQHEVLLSKVKVHTQHIQC